MEPNASGGPPPVTTPLLTLVALLAFAGNSLLCRLALLPGADGAARIDPELFTAIRLGSGALLLLPVLFRGPRPARRPLAPALALWAYAIGFSLSYVTLPAGVGALLLFGAVQVTMAGYGWLRGDRLRGPRAVGFLLASGGLVYLVLPVGGAAPDAPDPVGALLMAGAGVAWGAYSLMGRGASQPVRATAWNFLCAAPLGLLGLLGSGREWSPAGIALAVASGALTSALGYAIWYAALRHLSATSAGIAQLTVPVIAAAGGVVLLGEAITLRLVLASALVLGGVGLALGQRAGTGSPGALQSRR